MARLPVMAIPPPRPRSAPILLASAAALALCCGTVDGTDPYSLWRTYEDPGRAYHFHYPSPPWTDAADSALGLPVFEVDPDGDPLAELPAARLRLEARAFFSADLPDVIEAETGAWQGQGYSSAPPREIVSAAGDVGLLLEARLDEVWVRQVFHEEGGTVSTLLVWGRSGDPDEPDIELLLESFEPRGAGGD